MLNLKFIKLSALLLISVFAFLSLGMSFVFAESSEVKIQDVKIEIQENKININAVLYNQSADLETSPFTYLIILENSELLSPLLKESDDLETFIVSADEGRNYITLKPMESRKVNYKLEISSYLPKALYTLRLGVIKSDGSLLGKFSQVLSDIGSNSLTGNYYKKSFLVIDQDSCYVISGEGKKYLRNSGVVFEPGASPKIGCKATNVGSEAVSAVPVILWKEFFVYGRPDDGELEAKNYDKVNFNPGESKTVEILLPGITKPQVYQALLGFVDQNNQNISYDTSFRWTVKGSSARIERVALASPLKPSYKKGEAMSLSVDYFGSMDLYWQGINSDVKKLEDVKIEAIITDSSGLECGRKTASVENAEDGLLKNALIDIVLDEKCNNPQYAVSILSEGEKLNEQVGSFPNPLKETPWLMYSLFGLVVFVILALIIFIKRKKKNGGSMFMLTLVMSSIFFFGFANDSLASTAGTEVVTTVGNIKTKTYTGTALMSSMGGSAFNDGSMSDKLKSYYWDGQLSSGFNTARVGFMQLSLSDFDKGEKGWLNFELEGKHEFSCSNESAKFKIWVTSRDGNTGSEGGVIQIKQRAQTSYKEEIKADFGDPAYSSWGKDLDVKFEDLYSAFYDSSGKLKTQSPQIVFYLQQVGKNHTGSNKPYFVGFFGNAGDKNGSGSTLLTEKEAFEKGDILRVIIPIGNLPDPKVTLTANPMTVTFPNRDTALTWSATDVDSGSCEASSLVFKDWTGGKSDSGSETIEGVWSGTNFTANETHEFTLTCKKKIGNTDYYHKASVSVLANAPPLKTLVINRTPGGGSGEVRIKSSNEPFIVKRISSEIKGKDKDGGFAVNLASYFSVIAEASSKKLSVFADKKLAFEKSSPPCLLPDSSSRCSKNLPPVYIELTAVPDNATLYKGEWSNCPGVAISDVCNFLLTSSSVATASFPLKSGSSSSSNPNTYTLTLTSTGGGYGTVSAKSDQTVTQGNGKGSISSGTNMNCIKSNTQKSDCTFIVPKDATISGITVVPDSGSSSYFVQWGSGSSGCTGSGCSVCNTTDKTGCQNFTMTADKILKAVLEQYSCPTCGSSSSSVPVPVSSSSSSIPTSSSSSVSTDKCGATNNACDGGTSFDVPDSSTQYKWKCGSLSCELNKDPDSYSLTFRTGGNGSGYADRYVWQVAPWNQWAEKTKMVNGNSAGIGRDYKWKLTAKPDTGSYFSSWSGCDSISGEDCFLNENPSGTSKTVTAVFNSSSGGAVLCDPKVVLSARDSQQNGDNTTYLYWYSSYSDSCSASGGGNDTSWPGIKDVKGTFTTDLIRSTRTYNLTCSGGSGGSVSDSVTVASGNNNDSSYMKSFEAIPNPVTSGKSTKIYWTFPNTRSGCWLFSATDPFEGSSYYSLPSSTEFGSGYYRLGLNNNEVNGINTGNLFGNTTYKLKCTGYDNVVHKPQLLVTIGVDACSSVPVSSSSSSSFSSISTPVDGKCGKANKTNSKNPPQNKLCDDGSSPSLTETTTGWTWTCSGTDGGKDASCSAGKLEVTIQEI